MLKKALIFLAIAGVVLAGAGYWAYHSLDFIVKSAIEHFGPDVTGVSIKVGDVKISARDGRGSLKGVEIGNPGGFSSARAARLGEIRVAIDPLTLRDPVVVVREIAIEAPEISYERGARETNLDVIQRNISRYASGGATDTKGKPPPGERASSTRYVIERITIRNARVTMTNPALKGQGITFTLPDIQLRDLGKGRGGVSASQAANIVTAALVQRIAQRVLTNFELLRKGGTQGAIDALRGLVK